MKGNLGNLMKQCAENAGRYAEETRENGEYGGYW